MNGEWLVIRGSGIVAFTLLSASVIWGLLTSTKLLSKIVKAKPLTWFHESLGIGALLATLVHIFVLSIHDFLDFTWAEILIPGRSDWRPLPIAFGVVSLYGLAIVALSFYVKKWIGQRAWRSIHYGSFGVFVASLIHGIQSGTDSGHPLVIGLYAGSVVVVMLLLAHRVISSATTAAPPSPRPRERVTQA